MTVEKKFKMKFFARCGSGNVKVQRFESGETTDFDETEILWCHDCDFVSVAMSKNDCKEVFLYVKSRKDLLDSIKKEESADD